MVRVYRLGLSLGIKSRYMNIDKLKKVIQEANPKEWKEEITRYDLKAYPEGWTDVWVIPIRLADVLLAIDKEKGNIQLRESGRNDNVCFNSFADPDAGGHWNLKDNNLDNQSNECKKFLMDLLIK